MNPRLRNALWTAAACVTAAYLGFKTAEGEYALPALLAVLIVGSILVRLARLPVHTIALGFLLAGNVIGNRGFAQLTPVSGLPLLPAEIVLGLCLGWMLLAGAFTRELPFRRNALNWAVLAWIVVGTVRVPFDVPRHGLLAIRDYAMTYYALFFFVVQEIARNPRSRNFLYYTVLISSVVVVPVFILFQYFPAFFLSTLKVNGVPLIYHKDDLTVSFIACGTILLFHRVRGRHRYWAWPLCTAIFLYVASGGSRAPIVGMFFAGFLLLLAGHWRYLAIQGSAAVVAVLAVVALSIVFNNDWAGRRLDAFTDHLDSLVDVTGTGRYESQDAYFKGDNNRFRAVWWRNVVVETWDQNPVFGLGFGADLAGGFVQEYYPTSGEEFNTRSPHNIVVTTFGRLGAVGVLTWLALLATALASSWRGLRRSADPVAWSLWASPWVLVVAATLGVVLEGPMGAVFFWTLLGLASAWPQEREATAPTPADAATDV